MASLKELRTWLDKQKGKKEQINLDIKRLRTEIKEKQAELVNVEKAHEIIKLVGFKTQQSLQYHISDITSLAMEAVIPDPYKLEIVFVERRNKYECDILFSRNDKQLDPMDSSGGGAVDIAAFALRIAAWSMSTPRKRNVIILDEPFRFVSVDLQEKASQMLKEISKRLGIQFIIVSHQAVLTKFADRVFEVSIKNGVSKIEMS